MIAAAVDDVTIVMQTSQPFAVCCDSDGGVTLDLGRRGPFNAIHGI